MNRLSASILSLLALATFVTDAAAASPCDGISFANGAVATAAPLPVTDTFDAAAKACLAAIGEGLKARPTLRTITVAVRLPDAQRLQGGGTRIGAAVAAALTAVGIPAAKISAVAPAAATNEPAKISIAFTEKPATQPVALAESVGGPVMAGPTLDALKPIQNGAMLPSNTYIQTGHGGNVALGLADGSRLRLPEDGLLLLGDLYLNKELRRVVQLDLRRGQIEAKVAPGGPDSQFEVKTRTGVAGVRGTSFRIVMEDAPATKTGAAAGAPDGSPPEQSMRVETIEGSVAVTTEQTGAAGVLVDAGQALVMRDDAPPGPPHTLLLAPTVKEPLFGALGPKGELSWMKLNGAKSYQVLVARDAEFTLDVRTLKSPSELRSVSRDLTEGKWFWRVAGVDDAEYVGAPSKIYAFTVGK